MQALLQIGKIDDRELVNPFNALPSRKEELLVTMSLLGPAKTIITLVCYRDDHQPW